MCLGAGGCTIVCMKPFLAGVATTIVVVAFAFFVLWFAVSATVGNPRVVECVKDGGSAVIVDIFSSRNQGYLRTYEVGACTVYFHASNKR